MEERTLYNKTCKYSRCGKTFQSESRNTRYCSDDCCAGAQKENRAKTQKNTGRRKKYDEDKTLARLAATPSPECIALEVLGPPPDDGKVYELHHYQCDPVQLLTPQHGMEGKGKATRSSIRPSPKPKWCSS